MTPYSVVVVVLSEGDVPRVGKMLVEGEVQRVVRTVADGEGGCSNSLTAGEVAGAEDQTVGEMYNNCARSLDCAGMGVGVFVGD